MPYDSICTTSSAIDNSVGTITYSGSSSTTATDTYTYTSTPTYVFPDPYASTSTTTSSPYTLTIGPTSEEVEKKIKDASDKIDQHVDTLEQDIDFLNRRQEDNINDIDELKEEHIRLKGYVKGLESTVDTLNELFKALDNKYSNMYTTMLLYNERIANLEEQIHEMDKRDVG